ncbi:nuclear transport factor 2 family protein [Mesorhizobium sp. WSM3868]|uniref:YybH family protein n=1 Tax=Mesorhizobium sp. WSM3868 TaxID=2029405 RepID=UPI000BB02A1C|nr:nuclear transport factor 2 family protein [Mesorhizobium sp. WSM3868]PBB39599.1 hypothetical protein CK221_01905 [Mesorhizobium sp. WSM3868]
MVVPNRMIVGLVVAVGLVFSSPVPAGSGKDVLHVVDLWVDAFNSRDAAELEALYASNAKVMPAHKMVVVERIDWADFINANVGKTIALKAHGVDIEGNVAYVSGVWDLSRKEKGSVHEAAGNWTMVLRRKTGRWLIVLHIWNEVRHARLPPKQ